jgi:hypothetical protein
VAPSMTGKSQPRRRPGSWRIRPGTRAGRIGRLITFQPLSGSVDAEHSVFVGQDPERAGEPVASSEVGRAEWVPLGSVPGLIAAGEVWNAGSLVALLRLLTMDGQAVSH